MPKKDKQLEKVQQFAHLTTMLRNRVSEHNRYVKETREVLDKLEVELLQYFKDNTIQNIQLPEGTVFKSKKPKLIAKVTDREAFLQFIRIQDAYFMMDVSANKTAIAEYLEEHKQAPPGVFCDRTDYIQFRRKGESFE